MFLSNGGRVGDVNSKVKFWMIKYVSVCPCVRGKLRPSSLRGGIEEWVSETGESAPKNANKRN